jgi:hypothetical protein
MKSDIDEVRNTLWPHGVITDEGVLESRHVCKVCQAVNLLSVDTLSKLVAKGVFHGFCYGCSTQMNIIN